MARRSRRRKYALMIAFAALIPVIGYGVMHLLVYILPVSETNTLVNGFFAFLIIVLGLAVPYWMLKAGIHAAHLQNPEQKEITLKDLPKDQY